MLQVEALEILKTGSNIFLTGVPGAGKTYVINQYVKYLVEHGIYPSITASTGIAATHISGSTIHSWSGIGIEKDINEYKLDEILTREKLVKKIQNASVLIIDEISMLDAATLDNVNKVCKAIKNPSKSFGGLQVIFVGDFFQLPPVTKFGEMGKHFAFASTAWKEAKPLTCYLEEQFRQSDEIFTNLLLAIRANNIEDMHVEILEELVKRTNKKLGIKEKIIKEEFEEVSVEVLEEQVQKSPKSPLEGDLQVLSDVIELHSHNKDVDIINDSRLKNLGAVEKVYKMITTGSAKLVEGLIKNCLSPEVLKLKVSAKVIFTKNDMEGQFVNGTLGEVVDLSSFGISVKKNNGEVINVKQADWAIEDDGKVKAKITQYPLRLAWAITVHKSQGMSLDEAIVSLGETFEYGQGYVALSRVRSLEGLHLKSFNAKSLRVNESISEFDEKILKDSKFIQQKLQNSEVGRLEKLKIDFILRCGGKPEGGVVKKEMEVNVSTQEQTLKYILEKVKLEDIAKKRNFTLGTIIGHVQELLEWEKINKEDILELAPKKYLKMPVAVKKAFSKFANDEETRNKLSPVFKELKEKYSYEDLKLYRIFSK